MVDVDPTYKAWLEDQAARVEAYKMRRQGEMLAEAFSKAFGCASQAKNPSFRRLHRARRDYEGVRLLLCLTLTPLPVAETTPPLLEGRGGKWRARLGK